MVIENVLEYGKAMAQFSEMFPTISHEGIDKILAWGYKKYIYSYGSYYSLFFCDEKKDLLPTSSGEMMVM